MWGKKLTADIGGVQRNNERPGTGGAGPRGRMVAGNDDEEEEAGRHEQAQRQTEEEQTGDQGGDGQSGDQEILREELAETEEMRSKPSQEDIAWRELHQKLQSVTIPAASIRSLYCS